MKSIKNVTRIGTDTIKKALESYFGFIIKDEELNRVLAFSKILGISVKNMKSVNYWKKEHQKYPGLFNFLIIR